MIALTYLIIRNFKLISKPFSNITNKTWIILLIIFLVALVVRVALIPHVHKIIVDEFWYMEGAKNFMQSGKVETCRYIGTEELCRQTPKPVAWSVMLGILFFIFGKSNLGALNMVSVIGALSIPAMFCVAYLLSKKEKLALYASLIIAFFPMQIVHTVYADVIAFASVIILITTAIFLIYKEIGDSKLIWIFIVSLMLLLQVRVEFGIFLFIFLISFFIFKINPFREKKKILRLEKHLLPFIICLFIIFITITAYWFQTQLSIEDQKKIHGDQVFSTGFLRGNSIFFQNLFLRTFNTLWIFIIAGAIFMFGKNRQELSFLLTYIISLIIVYSIFVKVREKYFVFPFIGLILLAAYGMNKISNFNTKAKDIISLAVTLIVLFTLIIGVVPLTGEPKDHLVLNTVVPNQLENDIPQDCWVVSFWPTLVSSTTDIKVISGLELTRQDTLRSHLKNNDCVLLYENNHCAFQGLDVCYYVKKHYDTEIYKVYKEGNAKITLYKIS